MAPSVKHPTTNEITLAIDNRISKLELEFLGPIKNQLKTITKEVENNKNDISWCKDEIKALTEKRIEIGHSEMTDIANEINERMRRTNLVRVTKAKDENEVIAIATEIIGKTVSPAWIKPPRQRNRNNGNGHGSMNKGPSEIGLNTFLMELDLNDKRDLFREKSKYLKRNANHQIGFNDFLTRLQLEERRNK